jgi:hypothetical protein
VEQVRALAPDAAGLQAGMKLATPAPWTDAGSDERGVWGSCRGSAKLPYQVACDLSGPAYRCSCPSRKFPCKHALGLLLLWAAESPVVAPGAPPPDVAAWLASRVGRSEEGSIAAATAGKQAPETGAIGDSGTCEEPADGEQGGTGDQTDTRRRRSGAATGAAGSTDEAGAGDGTAGDTAGAREEAARGRVAQRTRRIMDGMSELDLWLRDLVRRGFGQAQSQPYSFWDAMGARLVDAQAPATAAKVRRLAGIVHTGDGWPARLLAEVARLHLLASGWSHYPDLPEPVQADLRTAAGWPWPSEQVLAGPRERDRWYVLGRRVTEEEQVQAQRTWLWGVESGRPAVIVDFARPGAAFAWELWPGQELDADLVRFPGSAPLRVLIADRHGDPEPGRPPPAWPSLTSVASARGRALGSDPWIERWPVSVTDVTPVRRTGQWEVIDGEGGRLALSVTEEAGWRLLAASTGRPMHLVGEWEGDTVVPLGGWADGRMVTL